jgi:ubiquitin-protein ligase E3 C
MGDDEFFGTSARVGGSPSAPRNPMSLDELIVFSRLLLDVAFGLYQGPQDADGDTNMSGTTGPRGLRYTWEEVREKVTKCAVAIHARECVILESIRRPPNSLPAQGGRLRRQITG